MGGSWGGEAGRSGEGCGWLIEWLMMLQFPATVKLWKELAEHEMRQGQSGSQLWAAGLIACGYTHLPSGNVMTRCAGLLVGAQATWKRWTRC
jgi:hypothetical protein